MHGSSGAGRGQLRLATLRSNPRPDTFRFGQSSWRQPVALLLHFTFKAAVPQSGFACIGFVASLLPLSTVWTLVPVSGNLRQARNFA